MSVWKDENKQKRGRECPYFLKATFKLNAFNEYPHPYLYESLSTVGVQMTKMFLQIWGQYLWNFYSDERDAGVACV